MSNKDLPNSEPNSSDPLESGAAQPKYTERPVFPVDTPNAPTYITPEPSGLQIPPQAAVTQLDFDLLPRQFGHFVLQSKVGQGGAGIVFRALDQRSDQIVAVKLLRDSQQFRMISVPRFQKESKMQAEIESPFVARHLEFDQVNDTYYIASEFVNGAAAESLMSRFPDQPKLSLLVIQDLLRGLAAIHQNGVIHRDVKPGNLIIVYGDQKQALSEDNFQCAKLTDFGLARHVDQSESMALTQQRAVLGTPLYMAPEQYAESRSVNASADVYAAGATLYHMLAGIPPFCCDDLSTLAEKHRSEKPVSVCKVNEKVGEALSFVVDKALAKEPTQRYPNAAQMLIDIEQLVNAKPIRIRTSPSTPIEEKSKVRNYSFQWELNASVQSLWPLVSDTDRFNKAIGLPAPEFTFEHSPGKRKIHAQANFNGMKVRWLEHPFQWIVEKELSVLREFESGPFKWVISEVVLEQLAGDRTRLLHNFQVEPRGWFGRLLTPIQFGWQTKRSLDRVYQKIEDIANSQLPMSQEVPFGAAIKLTHGQKKWLESNSQKLKKNTGDQNRSQRLVQFLERASGPAVTKIRTAMLAELFETSLDSALEFGLNSVEAGLLKLTWDIICPVCRVAAQSVPSLKAIEEHAHCRTCNMNFGVDFSQHVELLFSAHPSIRDLEDKTYCIGGPFHAPHILAQNQLSAAQQLEIPVTAVPGHYVVKSPQLDAEAQLVAKENVQASQVVVQFDESTEAQAKQFAPGPVCLGIHNNTPVELQVRLEKQAANPDLMTAARAFQNPRFQQLFPDEIRDVSGLAEVSDLFVVLFQLPDADRLAEEQGDIRLRQFWQEVQSRIANEQSFQIVAANFDQLIVSFETAKEVTESLSCYFDSTDLRLAPTQLTLLVHHGSAYSSYAKNQSEIFGKCVREVQKIARNESGPTFLACNQLASTDAFDSLHPWLKKVDEKPNDPMGWVRYSVESRTSD